MPSPVELHPKIIEDVLDFANLIGVAYDDAAKVLRLHALAEYCLERIIRLRLPRGALVANDERFSFYHKLQLVTALNAIDSKTLGALRKLSKLRNSCAHSRKPVVSSEQLAEIGSVLGKPFAAALADFDGANREFRALAWALFVALTSQVTPHEIASEKLAIKPSKA